MRYPSLVIFDMDGLMFDTEKLTFKAWKLTAENFGFAMNESIVQQFIGITNKDILHRMSVVYGDQAPVQEWRSYMVALKRKLLDENISRPDFKKKGLDVLLTYLKSNDVATAVASSSDKQLINRFLNATGTKEYIDFCVSGDEVVNGKPDPEIFLKACEKAKVSPTDSLVLEDSPAGIKAAKRAGIPSFFIPDIVAETQELRSLATEVLPDLGEVKHYLCLLQH